MTVNVRDYGALADGRADDSDAFRQALATGQSVTVPAGVYALASYPRIAPGQRLIGEGMGLTTLKRHPANTSILVGVQGLLEHCTVDGGGIGGAFDLGLGQGGQLDHVRWQNGSQGCAEVQSGARITDCELIGAGRADAGAWYGFWIGADGVSDVRIEGTHFEGMRINAIFGGASNLRISRCDFINNHCQIVPTGGGQIDLTYPGGKNVWITDNYFGPCTGAASALEIDVVDRLQIRGNVIEGQPNAGMIFQSQNAHNVMIADNVVFDCGASPLEMNYIDNLIWVNNRFHHNGAGIRINAGGLQDRNNAVT